MNEGYIRQNTEQLGYDSIDSLMNLLAEVGQEMVSQGVHVEKILQYMGMQYSTITRNLLEVGYGTNSHEEEKIAPEPPVEPAVFWEPGKNTITLYPGETYTLKIISDQEKGAAE